MHTKKGTKQQAAIKRIRLQARSTEAAPAAEPRTISASFPLRYALKGKVGKNTIVQLAPAPHGEGEYVLTPYVRRGITHTLLTARNDSILVVRQPISPPDDVRSTLLVKSAELLEGNRWLLADPGAAQWLAPRPTNPSAATAADSEAHCERIRNSWRNHFAPREASTEPDEQAGLRSPQIGALYAALAHWRTGSEPATIVMPTGTGKTETMLAILVAERLRRLLVVVPSRTLREQIAHKFITLGLLRKIGVVGTPALYPCVGILEHRPRTPAEVDDFFARCNVVVTTMMVVGSCAIDVQQRIAEQCSHLFIDEAHHVPAKKWDEFRRPFLSKKPVLQFTATPFRTDGKHIDGKIIFNYPLRKAQAEEYFKPINFRSVNEFSLDRADEEIAEKALQQLSADLDNGLDHIIMARAANIVRAERVHGLYAALAPEHNPLLVHSILSSQDRRAALRALLTRSTRIVVCVDMLGEGFDLPELKIAALHDMHKSLAITLQFTGRFTRTKPNIGDATMIANIADADVADALRELYAEDADWNVLLRRLSEGATAQQIRRSEFLNGFTDTFIGIPLQNVFPKMSAVVYRTRCADWRPDAAAKAAGERRLYAGPTVNHAEQTLLFVTRDQELVPWGKIKEIRNVVWQLYVVHWSRDQRLLFINSSDNTSTHEDLAKAIGGEDVELIRGERVFRALHGINRPVIRNLGLRHAISRAIRFSMHVGADIAPALTEALQQNKTKSNLFCTGFEDGEKTSFGCSRKGRVWSRKIAYDISEWVAWCRHTGAKLIDHNLSTDLIFRNVICPITIPARPDVVPLAIEWDDDILERKEDLIHVEIGGEQVPFYEVGLELLDHRVDGPIRFRVSTPAQSADYEVRFGDNRVDYVPLGPLAAEIIISHRRTSLSEWFQHEPPTIFFANGASLDYNDYTLPPARGDRRPFDRNRIDAWDWAGIDLRRESQTVAKHGDSIQRRVILELLREGREPNYDIIFDDDGTREIADIVAIKVAHDRLMVHLFHCKYSGGDAPGARVEDLYAVCGQAQRSVAWKGDVPQMVRHLRAREDARIARDNVSRFEKGDLSVLADVSQRARYLIPDFKIFVVQPGVSRADASEGQLELLSVTELYLQETYAIDFGVIASP